VDDAVWSDTAKGKRTRQRQTWYRRRLRIRRTLGAVVVVALIAGACWQNAARLFSRSSQTAFQSSSDSFWARGNIHKNLAFAAANSSKGGKGLARIPGVYPYSVVPGGVKDPADLREAAARDYVIRRHFAHFDYSKARLERLKEVRDVYLSYRIRNTVFWTRKRIRLYPGELLLTDGTVQARARCGNQISDVAKPEVSEEEPDADVIDQPVASLEPLPPLPFGSSPGSHILPIGQAAPPAAFGGGFVFPYVPVSLPLTAGCPVGEQELDGLCHHKRHHGGSASPEPSSMILLGTGLVLVAWRYRRLSRPASI